MFVFWNLILLNKSGKVWYSVYDYKREIVKNIFISKEIIQEFYLEVEKKLYYVMVHSLALRESDRVFGWE